MSTYESNRYSFPASAITAGTFDNARLSSGSVTQHVDLSNLNADNLTSGTVPNARFGTPTFSAANLTSIPSSAPTQGSWTPSFSQGGYSSVTGRYQKVGRIVWCQAEGRMTSQPSSDNTAMYFNGLPFTSLNIISGGHTDWTVAEGDFLVLGSPKKITIGRNTTRAYIKATVQDQQHSRWLRQGTYGSSGFGGSYGGAHAFRRVQFREIRRSSTRNWWYVSFLYIANS
tara:strand:- start:481 stop:1164 length:684 start_codon:yes stop_codon:yes gene_type:complete